MKDEESGRIELLLNGGKVARRVDYLSSTTVREMLEEAREDGKREAEREAERQKQPSFLRRIAERGKVL